MTDLAVSQTLPGLRGRLKRFVESPRTTAVIAGIIIINAITLGLETSETAMAAAGTLLVTIDKIILGIFVIELAAKLIVYRLAFFKSGWNIFDFVIVAISLMPASGPLSVLRALRILRVLRLLSVVPQMRGVIEALLSALPGMGSIIAVLVLIFYIGAVLATKLFGAHPDPNMQDWFGTIGASMYSLFQIMTLESWSMGIARPTMELFPYAWAFFVPFIMITTFAVLNLFIAIIVNAMQSRHEQEKEAIREATEAKDRDAVDARNDALTAEITALRREMAELRSLLGQQAR